MERCPNCGVETRPGDQFCLNCGNRLTGGSQPANNQNQWGPPPGPPVPPFNQWGPPPGAQQNPWQGGPPDPPTTPTMPTVQAPFNETDTGGTTVANTWDANRSADGDSAARGAGGNRAGARGLSSTSSGAGGNGPGGATMTEGDYLRNCCERRYEYGEHAWRWRKRWT